MALWTGGLLAGWMGYGRDLPSSNRDQFGPGIGWSVSVHYPKKERHSSLCTISNMESASPGTLLSLDLSFY